MLYRRHRTGTLYGHNDERMLILRRRQNEDLSRLFDHDHVQQECDQPQM